MPTLVTSTVPSGPIAARPQPTVTADSDVLLRPWRACAAAHGSWPMAGMTCTRMRVCGHVSTGYPAILPIPGTTSIAHLRENLAAEALELTPQELAAISALVPEPASSGAGDPVTATDQSQVA